MLSLSSRAKEPPGSHRDELAVVAGARELWPGFSGGGEGTWVRQRSWLMSCFRHHRSTHVPGRVRERPVAFGIGKQGIAGDICL